MSIDKVGHEICCGCRTCVSSCPVNAITMTLDQWGFEFPVVDSQICINCGKCEKICPVLHVVKGEGVPKECGAAYSLDDKTKFKASSGGLFGTFAKYVISEGGIVFGAAFDENFQLHTQSAETLDELDPLYKSKYLLCNTEHSFGDIRNHLKAGRLVLYCSSPCQNAALKLFLRKDYDNLLTLDLVCHGIGSQDLFNKSIAYFEKKNHCTLLKYDFRFKPKNASSSHTICVEYLKGNKYKSKVASYMHFPYDYAYSKGLLFRESCMNCKYASKFRVGDITIGDFHTIEKFIPQIDRFAGVSMFICNTEKGLLWLQKVSHQLYIKDMDWSVIEMNNRFNDSNERRPLYYEEFMNLCASSFDKAVNKFLNPYKDWRLFYYSSPKFIRNLASKILKH